MDHEVGAVIARGGDDVARARILAAGLALEVEARGSSDVVARGPTVAVEVGPVPAGVVVADARVRDERHADRGDDGEAREEKKRGRDERAAAPVAVSGEGRHEERATWSDKWNASSGRSRVHVARHRTPAYRSVP